MKEDAASSQELAAITSRGRRKLGQASLPDPAVYELECTFIAWGKLLSSVVEWVTTHARTGSCVIDYLCGPGTVLAALAARRPDLRLAGVTLEEEYISHARKQAPSVAFEAIDVFSYRPPYSPDIAICTAGVHHISFAKQGPFLSLVADKLKPSGVLLLGEILLEGDSSAKERQISALRLGCDTLEYAIARGAPIDVIDALVDVLRNDLLAEGEYKLSRNSLDRLLQGRFVQEKVIHTWAGGGSQAGDHLYVCRNARLQSSSNTECGPHE